MSEATAEISPKKKFVLAMLDLIDRDPQIAALQPDESVRAAIEAEPSLVGVMEIAFNAYADRQAFSSRAYDIAKDGGTDKSVKSYLPAYSTTSYAAVQAQVKGVAAAWQNHPDHGVEPGDMVCTMGFTSADFAVLDFACLYIQAVTVPLQSATSGGDLTEIFANIEPVTLAAHVDDLVTCANHCVENGGMRSLIVFDYDARDDYDREQFEAAQKILDEGGVATKLIALQDLVAYGSDYQWQPVPSTEEGGGRMAAIIHSSGSTGKPKGAIISEDAIRMTWISRPNQFPIVTLVFAPLNHLLGRNSMVSALRIGGTCCFTLKSDMSTLFDDIRLSRPTYMSFFPRIFEMVYQHYQNEVAQRVRAGEGTGEQVSAAVMKEMGGSYLGDRLKGGVVGGAPTSKAVMDFMADCFDMLLANGYGNTESGSGTICIDNIIQRPPVLEYKLRDVPELGYYTTDKPYPRGELIYKSSVGTTQYYKQPEATAGLLDEDGFSLTGDIVEERGPDHVVIIDRRKDVLKLSQGEYVAVGNLGTVFEGGSSVIKQIYIYGNSLRAYLVAVVVPDEEVATAKLGEGYDEIALKNLIRDEMQVVAKQQGLKSFEVPRDFIIELEPFSQENGLLSSVRKRLRPALERRYGERLEALYDEQELAQEEEIKALKDPDSPLSTLEKLTKLIEVSLKIQGVDPTKPKTFAELGGDSLGAVLFALSIQEVFGAEIPADTILSPTGNPQKWAQLIDSQLSGEGDRPTFAGVHGKEATKISADELDLAKFIDEETLAAAANVAEPADDPKTVLLTGANGFLGHIVALEWLEKLAPKGGKLVCLIRGADDDAARKRLDQAYQGLDPAFEARYNELAGEHLEVLAGDAGEARLGLSESNYNRLTGEVDRISHVAALVNHRFSYQNLFGPNVVGTAEIIRLALTERKKPIDFVSTEAVYPLTDTREGANENSPLLERIKLFDHYAAGYGASKWAGEHLLLKANQQFGLPVNTFRGDMMLSHQTYNGQMNTADMFTRILFSIIKTGLAPYSFYELAEDGSRQRAHYDGTPVDVVAAAVAGVADNTKGEYRNYNIHNYHDDDGRSLDAFVDAIESAGYPLTRIQDHGEWVERFKEKLNALSDEDKQQSALEIMLAFSRPLRVHHDHVGCDNFKGLMKQLAVGPDVPNLSEQYIHKCIEDMRVLGLVEAAQ